MSDAIVPSPFTHSLGACFRACPRKAQLRYEYGLRLDADSFPVKVGHAFHAAVEAAAKGLDVEGAIGEHVEDPYDLALVAAMFDGHERRWAGQALEHVESEMAFDLPLVNPDTGRASPLWRLQGKIDRIVRLPDGRLALMEYKSTSKDFAPSTEYWTRLRLDMQLSIYVIAARALGFDLDTVLYDVTRRPLLRPLKATALDQRKYTKEGKLYANQRLVDETPEQYAERLAAAIAEDPDKHFARIEIARLDQDLEECRAEIWSQAASYREAKNAGRFYRNVDACFQTGMTCEYVPVCQFRDLATRTPDGFKRLENRHPELVEQANA